MQGFRNWLTNTIQAVKNNKLGTGEGQTPLRVVMGNTSCDVDSAIGAIALAYYYTKKSNGAETWLPVINTRKSDFYCNLEIVKHLENCAIPYQDLYYYDEFRAQYPGIDQVEEVALIDHNILDVNQSDLGPKVTYVIDHHIDSGAYAG